MRKIIEGINAAILLCMFLITVATVIFRVVLQISASWSEDLAQYSFIFLVFIGSAALMQNESHINISVLPDRLNAPMQRVFRILVRLLVVPFMYYLVIGAWRNITRNWDVSLSTVKWMKIGYMYAVVFASGCVMSYYLIVNFYRDLFNKQSPDNTDEGGRA